MPTSTTRLALTNPIGIDSPSELRVAMTANNATLDKAVTFLSGTLAAIPAPSLAGRRYYATDAKIELWDTGSSWVPTGTPTPIGAMMQWAGAADPVDSDGASRWLIADGRAINRTTYATCFSHIGTTWGAGNGSTTFNIPDLRGRVPVGADAGGAHLSTNHPALAATGGEEAHALTNGENGAHSHAFSNPVPSMTAGLLQNKNVAGSNEGIVPSAGGGGFWALIGTTGNSGSGTAHNNLQPYAAVNHIIKVL